MLSKCRQKSDRSCWHVTPRLTVETEQMLRSDGRSAMKTKQNAVRSLRAGYAQFLPPISREIVSAALSTEHESNVNTNG